MSTEERWVVIWFPPGRDHSKSHKTEQEARDFAATKEVAEWHPLLEHRITTTTSLRTLVPLSTFMPLDPPEDAP